MSISLSKAKLCDVLKAEALIKAAADQKLVFRAVEFDSRAVRGGELFVALKGATTHGHQFVPEVMARGASLALVEDASAFKNTEYSDRIVVVPDTLTAFSNLARWWRRELNTPLFAITGSVGKTTVKELAAHILLGIGPGQYSKKSYNNHVGVPYTLCGLHPDHRWAVLEMGMNHAGELRVVTNIGEPDHVGITNIAPAHIENFGTLDAIAAAKFEIVEGLRPKGHLLLRKDDVVLMRGLTRIDPKFASQARFFGLDESCDAQVSSIVSYGFDGIGFNLSLRRNGKCETASVKMSILGTQNAYNAACASLIAELLAPGIELPFLVERLSSFVAPLMRMNSRAYEGGWRLIDDSYNANPASVGAFLDLAADLVHAKHRVSLIVGDMLELGAASEEYHRKMGEKIATLTPHAVVGVGPMSSWYLDEVAKKLPQVPQWHAPDPVAAAEWVLNQGPSVIMVKGSRGIRLDQGVELIDTKLVQCMPNEGPA